jgi:hypothetical protein
MWNLAPQPMIKAVDVRINAREIQHIYVCGFWDGLVLQTLLSLLIMEVTIVILFVFLFFSGTFYKRKPLARVVSYQ